MEKNDYQLELFIKNLCKERGITFGELAKRVGRTHEGLYKSLKKQTVSFEIMLKLSFELEFEPKDFFHSTPMITSKQAVSSYKDKYYQLLEKYTVLLEDTRV